MEVNLQLLGVRDAVQMLDDGQVDLALGILAELRSDSMLARSHLIIVFASPGAGTRP